MLDKSEMHEFPPGFATIVSDRIISALAGDDVSALNHAQAALESLYLVRLAKAPASAASAARGDGNQSSAEAAAFGLGQIGIAHAIAARAASRRTDSEFERRIRSRPLEGYIRVLLDAELSGRDIAERLGKDEAEVSRRLKILRQIGAVECRKEGNRTLNFLTPAARMVARARHMGALASEGQPNRFQPEVVEALDGHRKGLPEELRNVMFLVAQGDWRNRR